jgi:endonuclease G
MMQIRNDSIVTPDNHDAIAEVLADPANAWRGESRTRKLAHVRLRGSPLPADVGDAALDVALERVLDTDDLVHTDWLRRGDAAADTVAKVHTPAGDGTGFLVSDHLLLTNHHVLPDPAAATASEAWFRYVTDDGRPDPLVLLDFDPARCFVTSPVGELDFTLVAVAALPDGSAPGQTFGHVPLVGAVGKMMIGQPVNIIQHPGGRPRRVAFRNNLLVSLEDAVRFVYKTDTEPGASGAPVFNDQWQLVALHHRSEQARDAAGQEIDINGSPVTADTPDRLRNWVANAGIRVSCLVTHLRSRDLSDDMRRLVDQSLS